MEPAQVRLVFDGERVTPDMTPASLEMDDNDTVDAFLEQIGGGCSSNSPAQH